jgi:hypothetical protein
MISFDGIILLANFFGSGYQSGGASCSEHQKGKEIVKKKHKING